MTNIAAPAAHLRPGRTRAILPLPPLRRLGRDPQRRRALSPRRPTRSIRFRDGGGTGRPHHQRAAAEGGRRRPARPLRRPARRLRRRRHLRRRGARHPCRAAAAPRSSISVPSATCRSTTACRRPRRRGRLRPDRLHRPLRRRERDARTTTPASFAALARARPADALRQSRHRRRARRPAGLVRRRARRALREHRRRDDRRRQAARADLRDRARPARRDRRARRREISVLAIGDGVETDVRGAVGAGDRRRCSSPAASMPTTSATATRPDLAAVARVPGDGRPRRARVAAAPRLVDRALTAAGQAAGSASPTADGRRSCHPAPASRRSLLFPLDARARRADRRRRRASAISTASIAATSRLLEAARAEARALGVPAVVLTFEPHPRSFFRPEAPVFRLTPLPPRRGCSRRSASTAWSSLPSTGPSPPLTAEDVRRHRSWSGGSRLGAAVVGYDFHFGKGTGGHAGAARRGRQAARLLRHGHRPGRRRGRRAVLLDRHPRGARGRRRRAPPTACSAIAGSSPARSSPATGAAASSAFRPPTSASPPIAGSATASMRCACARRAARSSTASPATAAGRHSTTARRCSRSTSSISPAISMARRWR